MDDGYVLLPGAVPRGRVDAALRAINRSLGQEGLPRERLAEMRARTFCSEIVAANDILDLYRATAVRAVAEAAIGAGRVRSPAEAQIALRFPEASDRRPTPHIDGQPSPNNGVPGGSIYHFTALAAVFLSDVDSEQAGNFTVWPGSHERLATYFRAHGPSALLRGFPPIELPPPRPLLVRAGDAVLAHYTLAHGVSVNLGPHIRYAVFFRLFHAGHDSVGTACMTDLWREWEGISGRTSS